MTVSYQATGAQLTISSETPSEIIMLGRLKEKMPDSFIQSDGRGASITVEVVQLVKVAANGKLS